VIVLYHLQNPLLSTPTCSCLMYSVLSVDDSLRILATICDGDASVEMILTWTIAPVGLIEFVVFLYFILDLFLMK
jgi:hypothetical protein